MAEGSPTVRRRELGVLLRQLREEKGLSVKQVTEHLLCSPSKVSRIETGQRGATLRDVRDLCNLYGVSNETTRQRLMRLAREGKQQGWWQAYELPYATSMYVGLEAEAIRIKDYDSIVPGLLQTPDYVRALHDDPLPEPTQVELTPQLVEQRVEARLRRQQLLSRKVPAPLEFRVILDEAALHRVIGGPRVMSAQLKYVVRATDLPNVTVQVIPFSVGTHPALDSTFNILEFDGPVSNIVYSEGLSGFIFLERPEDVQRYEGVFHRLSQVALSPGESCALISRISQVYEKALKSVS